MAEKKPADWHNWLEKPLLKQALTHPSCGKIVNGQSYNNQRLEFLGDAVLGLVIADMLYAIYPQEPEGDLARRQASLVCGARLVEVARALGLGALIEMSESEAEQGGRDNPSNLEDACEALIGALYLDAGLEVARQFVYEEWEGFARQDREAPKDAKTALQEWVQARGMPLPLYKEIDRSGPAHAPEFTMEVSIISGKSAHASAASKRVAEQQAAASLLATLMKEAS